MFFKQIRYLLPLLVTACLVVGVHGLQLTFVGVRAAHQGFSVPLIGIMSAAYSLGFAAGCLWVLWFFSRLSHSQTFAILIALAAFAAALMAVSAEPAVWVGLRFVSGFAYAGLLALIDGYINANVTNAYRAQMLSVYRLLTLGSVAAAQYAIHFLSVDSPALFLLIPAVMMATLVPFAFIRTVYSDAATNVRFDPARAWRMSPVAVLGAIAAGMTTTTFRSTGPIYAHSIGMTPAAIATFMSAGMIGGLMLQYPLAFASDRTSRIAAIVVTVAGAIAMEGFLAAFAGTNELRNIIGIMIFGAFSFPVYSLCAAHGNDRADKGDEYLALAASLLFFVSVGGAIGPLIVSALMQQVGEAAFFAYMMSVHGLLGAYAAYRLVTDRLV